MSIEKYTTLTTTYLQRGIPQEFNLVLEPIAANDSYTRSVQEWVLRASLEVRFWSTDAHLSASTLIAKRVLASQIYSDVLAEFPQLRLAIMGRDTKKALECMDRIDKFIQGE